MAVPLTPEQICLRLLHDGRALLSSLRSSIIGAGAAPALNEAIEALENVAASDDHQMECAICLDQLLLAEKDKEASSAAGRRRNTEMPCGHRFHGGCLERWLRVNGTCPTCRHQLPPAPQMTRADWSDVRYRWFVDVHEFQQRMRAAC